MKKNLILKRELDVFTHVVKASIATLKPCKFPRPILLMLQEKGVVTPELVASELLCNPYLKNVAQLWIRNVLGMGLIDCYDNRMVVSERGAQYLKDGLGFVVEEGEWMITYCASDCCIENRIIEIKKVDSTKMRLDERTRLDKSIQQSINSRFLPKFWGKVKDLSKIDDREICSMLVPENVVRPLNGKEYRILEIDLENSPCIYKKSDFSIQWNVTKKNVSLIYNGKEYKKDVLPDWAVESEKDIIESAVSDKMKWMNVDVDYDESGKLRIPFIESLSDETKRNLVIDCPINKTNVGMWDEVNISVEVTPASENDAIEWFAWLFVDGIDGYMADNRFKNLWNTVCEKIGWFADCVPKRSFLEDVLQKCEMSREKKMFIQATLDWNL